MVAGMEGLGRTMFDEPVNDPLRRIIAEFRTDVNRLIVDQMARLTAAR